MNLNKKKLITQSILLTSTFSFFVCFLSFILLQHLLGDRIEIKKNILAILLLSVPFLSVFTLTESVFRILNLKIKFFSLVFTSNSVLLLFIYITYLQDSQNLERYVLALSATWFLIGLFSLFCARQYLYCYVEGKSIINGLKYSVPLAGTSFLTGCSPLLERGIISIKFGVGDLAIYSFASKFTLLVAIFISGIQLAVYPLLMRNFK